MKLASFLLALAFAFPAAAELPSWDDPAWYAAPPNPLNLAMTPDTDRGVTSTIGPEGGSISATGANGDVYSLTIPEGALFTETGITLLPVATAEGLPEGSGPFSGVVLQPDGLQLARTAQLEITPATPIPVANRALWGFYGMGEDARGEINLPGAGDRIIIPIDHFSGAGVSFADRVNLQLDRWRQNFLEDRLRSQLAQLIREANDGNGSAEAAERAQKDIARVLQHGWRTLASRPASTCADLERLVQGLRGIRLNGQILGVAEEASTVAEASHIINRYWDVCFPEKVQLCVDTGDLREIVSFYIGHERERQLIGQFTPDPMAAKRQSDVRAALERCGQFRLDVSASGRWQDPSGVAGDLSFRVEMPMRLTFNSPEGLDFVIKGEAPASTVSVSFKDAECWRYEGFINGQPMQSEVTTYEFRFDGSNRPLRLELRASAPEILADISCDGYKMQPPISPMVWAVAHQKDRTGEVFKLARFQAKAHPTLFEMEWTGQGAEDGLNASDTTRLKLIHIAK